MNQVTLKYNIKRHYVLGSEKLKREQKVKGLQKNKEIFYCLFLNVFLGFLMH
jgi:hypothetical protein